MYPGGRGGLRKRILPDPHRAAYSDVGVAFYGFQIHGFETIRDQTQRTGSWQFPCKAFGIYLDSCAHSVASRTITQSPVITNEASKRLLQLALAEQWACGRMANPHP